MIYTPVQKIHKHCKLKQKSYNIAGKFFRACHYYRFSMPIQKKHFNQRG